MNKYKVCTGCYTILLASSENFNKQKTGKYGLTAKCKRCINKYSKTYREANKEEIKARKKTYYEAHKEELKAYKKTYREAHKEEAKAYREAHKEEIKVYKKAYRETHKEEVKAYGKVYREEHKEKAKAYCKAYYEANKEEAKAYCKAYYEANKGKIKVYNKVYREVHKEEIKVYRQSERGQVSAFNSNNKRRSRLSSNGGEITKDQWLEVYKYFNWTCAYSGEKLNKDNRSLDHIISINVGGTNNIWNVIPMIRSLNCSKQDKNMWEWYKQQPFYSKERLEKILEWVEYAKNKYKDMEGIDNV